MNTFRLGIRDKERQMKKTGVVLLAIMLLGIAGIAYGNYGYMTSFNDLSYTSSALKDKCIVCHESASPTSSDYSLNKYGTDFLTGNNTFNPALEAKDSDGDTVSNKAEIIAGTNPGDVASKPAASDSTPPTVSSTTPAAGATGAAVTGPVTATFSEAMDPSTITSGTFTLSGGVSGNVSYDATSMTATFTLSSNLAAATTYTAAITTGVKDSAGNQMAAEKTWTFTTAAATPVDNTPPTVTFSIPSTAASTTVTVTLSATDAGGAVAGYLVKETATDPAASDSGWVATAPASYEFSSAGTKTLYAWAKDSSNNISTVKSAGVTITISGGGGDTTPPTVTFSMPSTATSLTVPITLSATDIGGTVTGYLVKLTSVPPAASDSKWVSTHPTSYTFT
ncbi:MAG: Ig-like domain-containing protein, partial [Deltaproteobacteria bacterium]|nr:Ig-like domain-containing protein [Deltaproteobacteria bacterium]